MTQRLVSTAKKTNEESVVKLAAIFSKRAESVDSSDSCQMNHLETVAKKKSAKQPEPKLSHAKPARAGERNQDLEDLGPEIFVTPGRKSASNYTRLLKTN
jgi:hypothetical protein